MSNWNEAMWFSLVSGIALKSFAVLGLAWLITVLLKRGSAAAPFGVGRCLCRSARLGSTVADGAPLACRGSIGMDFRLMGI